MRSPAAAPAAPAGPAAPAAAPRPSAAGPLDLDAAIVDLVSRGAVKVPPYPAVALRLEALVRREDYGLDELARLVASDQALAADALRCANSVFYARGAPVTSLQAAVARIGSRDVVRLALASGLAPVALAASPLGSLRRRIWLRALASAGVARELARVRGAEPEEALACGLLHDFGEIVAVACLEEILGERGEVEARPLAAWEEVVARYHVELGLVLAARWNLPPLLSDVISLHHGASGEGAVDPAMVDLVRTVDEVVGLLDAETHVSAAALARAPSLRAAEREAVAGALERLPGFIASFEGGAGAADEASLIEPARADDLMVGPTPVSFPVTVSVNRVAHAYRAMAIASSNLMVSGADPLPDNVLAEMKMACDPPLTCWGTAKLSWREGDRYTVLLQPFALSGPAQSAWKDLVAATTPGAAVTSA